MDLSKIFGIDESDPDVARIRRLVEEDDRFIERLVQLRRSRGMTQADVAEILGISQGAVARVEGGARDPRLSTLRRYAFAVGAEVTHTVTPRDEAQPPLVVAEDAYEWKVVGATLHGHSHLRPHRWWEEAAFPSSDGHKVVKVLTR